ncbi:MAG: 4-hydroxythreonine-4-phosphate dehydrogenase PdxA [Lysobacterales bacterium]
MNPGTGLPRLALTAGEPSGIGPELIAKLAGGNTEAELVAIGDPALFRAAAAVAGVMLDLVPFDPSRRPAVRHPGVLAVLPVPLAVQPVPGTPDVANARWVIETLARAADGALSGTFDAIVTGPVHKGIINDAGIAFTGHTEFFAHRAGSDVAMLLTAPGPSRTGGWLRIALATTHLPLAEVPAAITQAGLVRTLCILRDALIDRFGIAAPRLAVLGLNPHAGEGGHFGREEIERITPAIAQVRAAGFDVAGPLPADTALTPARLERFDAVLAMYHDQGLPVLKYAGFGQAVNVTLGLPFIRTSVDHGTAFDIAGRGVADPASLIAATRLACELAARVEAHRR